MKKIAVIGLGIIGGSICASLSKAGYEVDGTDIRKENVAIAKQKGYIKNEATNIASYEAVFLAVSPRATISLLETLVLKEGALLIDICGVKQEIEKVVYAKGRNYRYVGLHPMAGKETSGISSASESLFQGANLVVTHCDKTEENALEEAKEYAKAMGFGRIVECTAKEHDEKIALTSQLAHIVANAYVKSKRVEDCAGFTGGSFQDMTRIAGVDEEMWSQLYLYNRQPLLEELDGMITHLQVYKNAIAENDEETLKKTLKEGRLIRQRIGKDTD